MGRTNRRRISWKAISRQSVCAAPLDRKKGDDRSGAGCGRLRWKTLDLQDQDFMDFLRLRSVFSFAASCFWKRIETGFYRRCRLQKSDICTYYIISNGN